MTQMAEILRTLASFQAAFNAAPTDAALNDLIDSVLGKDQANVDFAYDFANDYIVSLADGVVIAWGAEHPRGRDVAAYFSADRYEKLGFVARREEID
ncbi:hypothetical protein [Microvirga sp. Mcv34]|uniref:hypothetical protein n=1 Tax=Microvirga sp. Mcv34 TaxID=2926016 RepID=UPI0021C5B2A7|nr:hypothetical protein [Microvirga sp. Mcv34]